MITLEARCNQAAAAPARLVGHLYENASTGPSLLLNPCMVSFVGRSSEAKTTMLERLAGSWKQKGYSFAYLKDQGQSSDEQEKPANETKRFRLAGADLELLCDSAQSTVYFKDAAVMRYASLLRDFDFILVDGFKAEALPKVVLLDKDKVILNELSSTDFVNVRAVVGPWPTRPTLDLPALKSTPYFNFDDVAGIRNEIDQSFKSAASPQGLYGLVLAGGKSRRMGQDKALMRYRGDRTQLRRCHDLLQSFCSRVFVSARAEQVSEFSLAHSYDFVPDTFLELGPLGGLLSAQRRCPGAAFLAVAIDLPALNEETLSHLVAHRNQLFHATAYSSKHGDFLEPLCTIYEAKSYRSLLNLLAEGFHCPAKMLPRLRVRSLKQNFSEETLVNVNTPNEFLVFQEFKKRRGSSDED